MHRNQPLFSSLSPPGEVKQEGGSVFREGTPYQRRGSLQLWQFLVALLDDPGNAHFIAWTGRGMEFKLIEPEEVSRRRRFCTHGSSLRASAPSRLSPEISARRGSNVILIRAARGLFLEGPRWRLDRRDQTLGHRPRRSTLTHLPISPTFIIQHAGLINEGRELSQNHRPGPCVLSLRGSSLVSGGVHLGVSCAVTVFSIIFLLYMNNGCGESFYQSN